MNESWSKVELKDDQLPTRAGVNTRSLAAAVAGGAGGGGPSGRGGVPYGYGEGVQQ